MLLGLFSMRVSEEERDLDNFLRDSLGSSDYPLVCTLGSYIHSVDFKDSSIISETAIGA